MAKKRVQQSDEEIALRAISQARQVDGRLFVSREGVFLVRGNPAFTRVFHCFAACREPPALDQVPTPAALGFPLSDMVSLTANALGTWTRALQKWRKILDEYEKPRQNAAERRRKHRTWGEEIEQLSGRLTYFQEVLRNYERSGMPVNAPYALPPLEEAELLSAYAGEAERGVQDALWKWLARVVAWIGGIKAGRRFLASLSPFGETGEEYRAYLALCGLRRTLRHLQTEKQYTSFRELQESIKGILGQAPGRLLVKAGLNPAVRVRDISPAGLMALCDKALSLRPPLQHVAGAAALCAVDGADAPVPRCILAAPEPEPAAVEVVAQPRSIYYDLAEESRKPSYDLLLRSLDNLTDVGKTDLRVLRMFLDAGVDVTDADWAITELGRWVSADFAGKGLAPGPLRRLWARLRQSGLTDGQIAVTPVAEKVAERGGTDTVEAFANWVDLLDNTILTQEFALSIWHRLSNLLILEKANPAFRDCLLKWSHPTAARSAGFPCDDGLSPEAASWLGRLAYYQELSGQAVALPKSLEKLLGMRERGHKELDYLRTVEARGQLDRSQAARLSLLERERIRISRVNERKLIRQTQEVCARVALEAVVTMAKRAALASWGKAFGGPPPEYLSADEIIGISAWKTGLDKPSARRLQDLIDAWRAHGPEYRGHLDVNLPWIRNAEANGINVASWLAPRSLETAIEGMTVRIGVSRDPFRVFLMGSYFGTCLSLDSNNRDSVLANAHDANKNVIFVFGPDGEVLGRKLVCLNTSNELIGYRTYVAANKTLTDKHRDLIASALAAFCGMWARDLRVPLGFTGQPAGISGLFWYDDGVETWQPAAYAAFDDHQRPFESMLSHDLSILAQQILEALRDWQAACIRLLQELDICPQSEDGFAEDLAGAPGLAEETLAIVARREREPELARLVFRHARTAGGQLEAITSVAQLDGEAFLPDLFDWLRAHPFDSQVVERAACLLRNLDTPNAWARLIWLALSDEDMQNASSLWVVLGVRHAGAVDALKKNPLLIRKTRQLQDEEVFLLAENMLVGRHDIPDSILRAILSTDYYASSINRRAQWLPPLKKPGGIVGSLLAELSEMKTYSAHEKTAVLRAAITIALRNPGTDVVRFLKKEACRHPAALLALALLEPGRFQTFIAQTAQFMTSDPAALIALVHVVGKGKAGTLFQTSLQTAPRQKHFFESACELYTAYKNLDLGAVASLMEPPHSLHIDDCFPILLDGLWRVLRHDAPDIDAIKRIASQVESLRKVFKANDVSMNGLAVRLARLLRDAAVATRGALSESLRSVLNPLEHCAEFLIPLDALSGHQASAQQGCLTHKLSFLSDVLEYGACSTLVFDEQGTPRPWVQLACWSATDHCSFPPDPFEARRLIDFVVQQAQWENPPEFLQRSTAIQQRLLRKALGEIRIVAPAQ